MAIIMSFEGQMGTGKSTGASALVYEDHVRTGRKVLSNAYLNFEGAERFTIEYFLKHILGTEIENYIIYLDEFYQLNDSRSSGSRLNKLVSYFILQSRKRGVDMYICSHYLDYLDLRTRRAVNVRATCEYNEEKPCRKCGGTGNNGVGKCPRCLGYGKVGVVSLHCLDRRPGQRRRRFTVPLVANRYWHLFNTEERVSMQAKALEGIDMAEVV